MGGSWICDSRLFLESTLSELRLRSCAILPQRLPLLSVIFWATFSWEVAPKYFLNSPDEGKIIGLTCKVDNSRITFDFPFG